MATIVVVDGWQIVEPSADIVYEEVTW